MLNLLMIIAPDVYGQKGQVDSLRQVIRSAKIDTATITNLNLLGRLLLNSNPDTTIQLSNTAIRISDSLFKNELTIGKANALGNMGAAYYLKSDFLSALDYDFKALHSDEMLNNKAGMAKRLGNIGVVYQDMADYPKALNYYQRALKIDTELGNKAGVSRHTGNIGITYRLQGNLENALTYYFKALRLDEELDNRSGQARHLGNIGSVYIQQQKFDLGIDFINKGLKLDEELNNKKGIAIKIANLGDAYMAIKQYAKAEMYYKRAIAIDSAIGNLKQYADAEFKLSELYESIRQYDNSLIHLKKYIELTDQIVNREKESEFMKKELKYEFEKKELAIKAEQERKKVETDAREKKKNILIVSCAIVILIVLVFSALIMRSLRIAQKQKSIIEIQKKEVEKTKHIIEERNQDITDSIQYARRIQQAKLPAEEEIVRLLPDSFMVNMPKDIVSGDFYFLKENKNRLHLAIADCTGHGVPGALMSMIGYEKLEEAIALTNNPSEILRLLNKGIKISLRQSESPESTRDGMDVALCSFDETSQTVFFSGANRPAWIYKAATKSIVALKPTKAAIGGLTPNDQEFNLEQHKLEKGDLVYIFSDGYADMFGGEKGKKLTTAKFRELLLSIQDKTTEEQGFFLQKFANNWMQGTEQIDDILVM